MLNINEFGNNTLPVTTKCDSLKNSILREPCISNAAWIIKLENETFSIMCDFHKQDWEQNNRIYKNVEYIPFDLEIANQMQKRIEELYVSN